MDTDIPRTTPRKSAIFDDYTLSEIRRAASTGIYDIRGGGSKRRLPHFDDLLFLGASMLGPYSSGLTKAIAPVTEKYQVPMVEAEGASRSLFNKGYKYLFAVLSTSEQYLASSIDLAAEVAKKNGKDPSSVKIAMAFENDPFSLDVRAGVVDDASKYGMTQSLKFKAPVRSGDTVQARVTIKEIVEDKKRVVFDTVCTVDDKVVLEGEATLMVARRAEVHKDEAANEDAVAGGTQAAE